MNHRSNQANKTNIKMQFKSSNIHGSQTSPKISSSQIYNQKKPSEYKKINQTKEKNEKIIHQSVRRNFDPNGNSIIRTKIVREVDVNNDTDGINSKSMMNNIQRERNYQYGLNNEQERKFLHFTNYSSNDEEEEIQENPEILYDENYEMRSPYSYNSQFQNSQKFQKFSERGYGGRSPGYGGGIKKLKIGEISPEMEYCTPENDFDGQRSFNYGRSNRDFMGNNPYINQSQQNEISQRRYKNYNLESPYNLSKYSPSNDFNSPDRGYDYNSKYFRNIPLEKIKGKKPFNEEKMSYRNNQFESSLEYDNNISMNSLERKNKYQKNLQERYMSYPEEDNELYDIVNSMATLIQSNVRGFLVRKKVLRFITLAIYYQSFCDKLQDVLSNNVKSHVMQIFKNKIKNIKNKNNNNNYINENNYRINNNNEKKIHTSNSHYKNISKENKVNNIPIYPKFDNNKYSTNIIKTEEIEYSTYRNPSGNYIKEYEINNINQKKKLRKEASYQNFSSIGDFHRGYQTYNKYNKSKKIKSRSPTSTVIHYFIRSPCSKKTSNQRYYYEMNTATTFLKSKDAEELNNHRSCHKCDEISRLKKQEKFYITKKIEKKEEEEEEQKEEYTKKYEEHETYMVQEKPEETSEYEEKIDIKEIKESKKHNQSTNNIFTHRKNIENDNYLSINILSFPKKDDKSKSVSKRDIFTNTNILENKISKVESINIQMNKKQKTDEEIEEEINRRVKITILEKEKERKRIEENNKKIIKQEKERKEREERLKREKEEREERERKEREERERKEREERERKEREERIKREEREERERKEREEQLRR